MNLQLGVIKQIGNSKTAGRCYMFLIQGEYEGWILFNDTEE